MASEPQLYKSFRKRLDAYATELPRLGDGNVGAVHRARVATRRLREVLPLLSTDRETNDRLRRRLRRVTRELGVVRELDVLELLINELRASDRYSKPALDKVGAVIARKRDSSRERLRAGLGTLELERLAASLEGACRPPQHGPDGRGPGIRPGAVRLRALKRRIADRAERALTAIEEAGTVYAIHYLHAVRIALKKLRYAAELLEEAGSQLTGDLAILKAGQDLLGRLHDLEVLLGWVRDQQASLSPPDLAAWRELRSLAHALEEDCRHLHGSFMHDRAALIAAVDRLKGSRRPPALDRRAAG